MIYLDSFIFPSEDRQYRFIVGEQRTCYSTFYPFMVLTKNSFSRIDFTNITILYGGNGSGKSTALNIIA
ncbi:MAG: AAA family ATPase, partial [Clostridium sp.]